MSKISSKINNMKHRNFEIFLVVLGAIMSIFAGIVGGYAVYWLEKDNSPQLYISSELNNDTLNIKILNMGDVAKDIIISYSSWGYELGDKTDPIPYL